MSIPSVEAIGRDMATDKTELGSKAATISRQAMDWAEGQGIEKTFEEYYYGVFEWRRDLEDFGYHPERIEVALRVMNQALDCHGVEYAKSSTDTHIHRDGFEYLNTGDAYTATIGYDWGEGEWLLTTWGDVVEGDPKRFGEENAEENPAGDVDEHLVRELVLWGDNDAQLYRQMKVPIQKNFVNKMAAGKYDSDKAVKGWLNFADASAKSYVKEFGGTWHQVFPKPERVAAAEQWARRFESAAEDGEYDEYLYKKHRR